MDFFGQIFMNVPSIKFEENPSSVGRVATDGQTGMTKLIGAFLYYANAPNKSKVVPYLSGSQWAAKQILFRYLLFLDSFTLLIATEIGCRMSILQFITQRSKILLSKRLFRFVYEGFGNTYKNS
jgi:hypothetical protein